MRRQDGPVCPGDSDVGVLYASLAAVVIATNERCLAILTRQGADQEELAP